MYNLFNNYNENSLWTEDTTVNSCHNCKNEFTLLNRRHHCRLCGKIFCNICCNYYVKTNLNNKLINIENYLVECINENNRLTINKKLCYQCFKLLLNIKEISRFIKIFELLPLNLNNIYKLLGVNKIWNKSIEFYLNNVKKIQYCNVSNILTKKQFNILWYNKRNICGHSKLVAQFIIYNNWNNYNNEELVNILNNLQIRKSSCKFMLCNEKCNEKLDDFDILYILKYTRNKYIKVYLLNLLNSKNINIYLPLLINNIKNDNENDYSITNYLKTHCNTILLLIQLFYQMFIIINNNNSNKIYNTSLQIIKDNLIKNHNGLYTSLINSIKLINLLCNIDLNNTSKYIDNVNNFIKNNRVYIPLNNEIAIESISKDIIIKNSNTKPILITVNLKNKTKKLILFKKEDVQVDYIISKIILLIKYILHKNNIESNLITYDILPINNNIGLIEIIDDSYTLYDIKKNLNLSLQNFILNNNKTQTIEIIKKRFINSLSIYSIITYTLGVGDRHLDNIMITKNGVIFHIDYSFCIGHDPKPFYPSMRITDEMIDMIGGQNSNNYKKFINNCNTYYNCIRKNTNIISLYIYLLNSINNIIFNEKSIKNHIIKKFLVMESDNYANNTLEDTITNCTDNYTYIDFFHYHSKEKTVSKTVFNIYDNSLAFTNYLKKYVEDLY